MTSSDSWLRTIRPAGAIGDWPSYTKTGSEAVWVCSAVAVIGLADYEVEAEAEAWP
jgi:hypothetical protein